MFDYWCGPWNRRIAQPPLLPKAAIAWPCWPGPRSVCRNWKKKLPARAAMYCDVSDEAAVNATVAQVKEEMGAPEILIHNAVGGAFGTFLEIEPQTLSDNFQVNTMGLLYLARAVAPDMIEAGKGVIISSGNTSALRGKPRFAGFAPTKAAQRILSESMARTLGTSGYSCRLYRH